MHQSVLAAEVIDLLQVPAGGTVIDGTLGSGGHAFELLRCLGPDGCLLGLDRDAEALERSRARLAGLPGKQVFVHGSFADIASIAEREGVGQVDGVLLDIGVSSDQLDTPERGFGFRADGPLDMRMDCSRPGTARELVADLSESELADVLWTYGEERRSRRVAREIKEALLQGSMETTGQLAAVVEKALGGRRGKRHPATRTFQALRIAVNGELDALQDGLKGALGLLRDGGRLAVISFHSLEDRIVKRFMVDHAGKWESLQEGGRRWNGELPPVKRITRKPVRPSDGELAANPRSRSSRLRVAERCDESEIAA